jgi:hypothetical protein
MDIPLQKITTDRYAAWWPTVSDDQKARYLAQKQ